ncbi:hypothetical protein SB768_30955 [Burkholderia sp. SIMBA_043]|uniref:hypothetical protein n=1 Tax=Burkholderia TaxID=32008 RepID=UPI00118597E3|nr:hypothetical protein [Burkholderia vietnamiensis]UBI28851.1 hypothetical protein LA325_26855 [Burkholderia vietnamiensis]HEP6273845.1 hypothetical protein [Burkholderia vietnamiensis]HEP6281935.1 hypothetical protein [Burkholderia vietnamiensis]HEP6306917.1 hypothetical protein [Burkholderia vietnamiensis]
MTEDWKTEYDQRQYRLMNDQLRLFETGKLDLPALIKGIKALLSALEVADESWKDKVRCEWGALETVYAIGLDRKEQGLAPDIQACLNDPANRAIIDEAVRNIRRLVQECISHP